VLDQSPLVIAPSDDRSNQLAFTKQTACSQRTKQHSKCCVRLIALAFAILTPCLLMAGTDTPDTQQTAASPFLFGMQMNGGIISQEPWPKANFGGIRLWDSAIHWRDINTADGVYDWSNLDKWLSLAQTSNVEVLYTFGEVPSWASSDPGDYSCAGGPGACDPPNDLNADGSGSDRHWKNFVAAIVSHNQGSQTGHIRGWEVWNEAFGNEHRWKGTIAQLLRMAQDARTIIKAADKSAMVLTPTFAPLLNPSRLQLATYLAAGGGQFADAIALHGYVMTRTGDRPEDLVTFMNLSDPILAKYGQSNKPLWDTEASWGNIRNTRFTDPDMQAAFVARSYLLHWSLGISRYYWYEWNNSLVGQLWIPDPHDADGPGKLLKPGISYVQVYNWIVGSKLDSGCVQNGTVWTCNFRRGASYEAQAIWDTAESCDHGTCSSAKYTVDPKYHQFRTVDGTTFPITNSRVEIGAKPILLESRSRRGLLR